MTEHEKVDKTEDKTEETTEHDRRTIEIDTGYYKVRVSGDPDDSLADVQTIAFNVADRAKNDIEDFDERLDGGRAEQYG